MALSIKDIKTKLGGFFQRKLKNLITLGNDSTLESDLKPIKVGDNNTPIEIEDLEEFLDKILNVYFTSINEYLVKFNEIKEKRTSEGLLNI